MGDYQVTNVQQDPLGTVQLELGGNPNALALRRPFDPLAHDLEASFRLTRFADLKGRGCKVPQEVLNKLVEGLQQDYNAGNEHEHSHFMHMAIPRIGIGLDCSVNVSLFQNNLNFYLLECNTSLLLSLHNLTVLVDAERAAEMLFIARLLLTSICFLFFFF